jgi:Flp pilus assembly protein TadD
MEDPRILFERARSALAAGDAEGAAGFARRLLAIAPRQPQVLHLLAVAERRNGRLDEARALFTSALAADLGNAEICNNFANLLDEIGEPGTARDLYRRAIERAPAYADALINLAVVCRKLDAVTEGLSAAGRAAELAPTSARAWIILGQLREDAGDGQGATSAFDQALAIEPRNPRALAAAAALALQRGGEAVAAFDRALAVTPDDPNLALGRAASLHARGDTSGAIAALEKLVGDEPGQVEAQSMLAKLHIAGGDIDRAGDGFRGALSARPQSESLWLAYLQTLSKLSDYDALAQAAEAARHALGDHPLVLGFSALAADELGNHDRAASLFNALDQAAFSGDRPDAFAVALVRNQLRTGQVAQAAARAKAAVDRGERPLLPYLATAWRLLGDPRWEELEGDPRFVAAIDSPRAAALVDDLVPILRRLHTDRAPPLGQTVRGGSQTEGTLFLRAEPVIAELAEALMEAVRTYVAQLPSQKRKHPLLDGARDRLRYSGSWSVRLAGGGFHVNHVHPAGWISSAFYLVTPPASPEGDSHAGWLTLGEPPAELGLGLAPFRMVEPRAGRLALFPAYTWHGTRPFGPGERLTAAFDVVRDGG